MGIEFFKVTTAAEREAINAFLRRHNQRGQGSTKGYVAYYAATLPDDPPGRPLLERLVAAAKFCPLHTPQAAKFYGGQDWRHVYCLQRLAAYHAPENLLSDFLGWCLREIGQDARVHYVATYAATDTFDPRTNRPHNGGIYRAVNAVYCGLTEGGRVEAYYLDGERRSVRCGPKTVRVADLPSTARLIRSGPMHRYCWAVGNPLERFFRRRELKQRMAKYKFTAIYQPRLPGLLTVLGRAVWAWFLRRRPQGA